MLTTVLLVLFAVLAFVGLGGLFKKPLLETRLEFLCQNTGVTFQVNVAQAHKSFTCRHCGRESFVVNLGEGKGNVSAQYVDAVGNSRKLDPVQYDEKNPNTLAQYSATDGTFIIVSQENP